MTSILSRLLTTTTTPRYPVRFGRVPKREKAKILAAMQAVNASSRDKALLAELEDERRLHANLVRAHLDTCDFTADKVASLIAHPAYDTRLPNPQLVCPLNPVPHILENGDSHYMEEFSQRFTPAIHGVVEFAKRIPGFTYLVQDDQVTLLKAGVFEALLVRLSCMFDSQANSLICLNGQVIRRDSLHSASNGRFLLDSMFDFAERLNALRLADSEVGLFCAVVVIAADRPGLRNTELVLKIQKKLMDILQKSVVANHPENLNIFGELMKKIPDLRTLNTLHSEKLLASKNEPTNQSSLAASSGTMEIVSNGSAVNPSLYTSIPHEIWSQYSLITTHPHCLVADEDLRSTSPGQHSQHSGSSTGSEWSTTDSKDDHDVIGSPRSIRSGLCVEDVKSPVRASGFPITRNYGNEDVWPSEGPQNEFQNLPKRTRDNNGSEHGSSSGDEGYFVDSPIKGTVYPKLRRVDSPTDSGIDSGKEHGPSTSPTISMCSSPQSTLDEKVKDVIEHEPSGKHENIEDMPVLKRALQAPPLVNTNMLMDEAYRHHKKFRAARRDAESPSNPGLSLASTHSTLVRTLEQAPRYLSEQQLKRTDLIHNIIMRTETLPGQQTSQTHQSQLQSHHPSVTNHTELAAQSLGTSGIQVSVNSSPSYTSVPNSSPVNERLASNAQQKSMLVCPSGYYIPHGNVTPIYSSSPVSWQFVGGQPLTTTAVSIAAVSSSPTQINTQYTNTLVGEHSSIQENCLATPHQLSTHCSSASQSVTQRLVYTSRSPTAPSSPLVMNVGPSLASSPLMFPSVCQFESRLSPPVQTESVDSQPLNLSKKLFSTPMLKMES